MHSIITIVDVKIYIIQKSKRHTLKYSDILKECHPHCVYQNCSRSMIKE